MSDSSNPITLQQVIDALFELKAGRSRGRWSRYVRSILGRYGDGARHTAELDPKFYPAVYAAAGGDIISAVKFYGAVVDLPPMITIPTPEEFYGVTLDVPAKLPLNRKSPTRPILRLRTPLVADLEAKLRDRVGRPRSRPTSGVNVGNPTQPGDEDAPRQYPSDGRKLS
jgi:hypothetical protein